MKKDLGSRLSKNKTSMAGGDYLNLEYSSSRQGNDNAPEGRSRYARTTGKETTMPRSDDRDALGRGRGRRTGQGGSAVVARKRRRPGGTIETHLDEGRGLDELAPPSWQGNNVAPENENN